MTTADIALGFSEFGWWLFGIEERTTGLFHAIIDWLVDRAGWLRREVARRKYYPTGQHRAGNDAGGRSVWDYLHALPIEELKYEWAPRGQHRDRRGWRYISGMWYLIQRTSDERALANYWRGEVDRLLFEVQYMLDHPPLAASVTVHGCQDCLCGQISAIRREALV